MRIRGLLVATLGTAAHGMLFVSITGAACCMHLKRHVSASVLICITNFVNGKEALCPRPF